MRLPTTIFSLALMLCLFAGGARAETIREIVVAENSKTTDATVLFIANIEKGDSWDESVRAEVEVQLVSSGLFKDINIFSEPHPKGGVKVTIIAQDKHSWVVAPTFYNQPTNKGVGIGFGENNLFGENKKLLLYGQVATGDSFFVGAYIDPSIRGTIFHYAIDTFLQNQRVFEYEIPQRFVSNPGKVRESKLRYLNSGLKLGLTLFRKVTFDTRFRGAYVFYGDTNLVGDDPSAVGAPDAQSVAKPGSEGWDISTEFILEYDDRANWYGISSGTQIKLAYEKSRPGLGSDFDYWYGSARFNRATRYFDTHNLVLKGAFNWGENLPFQQEFTSGGTALRGYEGNQFRGDLKASFNAEYSVHLFSMPFPLLERLAVRGLAFYDSRYTTFHNADPNNPDRNYLPGTFEQSTFAPFKNAVGVGTRFFARSIVLPLLGLDVGYGLESGAIEVYFAIGLTDI